MKKCCKCKEVKEFIYFGKLKSSKDGYRHDCKSCRKEYSNLNRDIIKEYKKSHYIKNRDSILTKNKEYQKNNMCKIESYIKEYWSIKENSKRRKENYKEWKENNTEHIKEYKRSYYKNITMTCPVKRIKYSMRSSVKRFIKNKGGKSTENIIGCSYDYLIKYIESKFLPWMSWNNYGIYNGELEYGWDIDHIIPLSIANCEDDIIKLNHYTNLQPLCSKINRDIKNNKTEY